MSTGPSPARSNRPALIGLGGAGLAAVLACLCLAAAAAIGFIYYRSLKPAADEPTVAYILDASPRMELTADSGGKTRINVAEAVLAEVIRPAEPSLTMGLRVFGTGAQSDTCRDTDLVVPFAPSNQARIVDQLPRIVPGPSRDAALAEAMLAAIRDLSRRKGPHWLVVVTGGADTCEPNAAGLIADEAHKAGIELRTFVIGYQLDESDAAAVKGLIAETAGSTYLGAPDAPSLRSILQAVQQYINSPSEILRAAIAAAATSASPATAALPTPSPQPTRTTPGSPTPSPTPSVTPTGTPTATPGNGTGASSPRSPVDLNGLWVDNNRQIRIAQSANEVTALYVKPYVCDHADGTGQTSTTDLDFTATMAGDTLTGQTSVCSFGAGNPNGVGIRMTALKLIVSADGLTLAGTWYDGQSRSDKPVSIKRLSSP